MLNIWSDIDKHIGYLGRFHDQLPFAAASAITATLKDIERGLPEQLEKRLDNPTLFTKRGTYVKPARKHALVGEVGFRPRQAGYLQWQVFGGRRQPRSVALRLPAVVKRDEHGNLPAGTVRQLVARARANKRATKTQARRFGVSTDLDLFYGEPGEGRPAGIYKRIVVSDDVHRLVPIVVFPRISAKYEKRFEFDAYCVRVTDARFGANFTAAWRRALATAR